ncbi:MAG TPA: nitrogen fixation protein NifQ [Aquabacterium sp.]|uniref:nitrogen fixation protein NifQ n=1 Tax=Aquabacterium sp. TaxID=1872578 RepID=UPI002E36B697|nr:nitrogen fixation protein NifQ [Aquabacterium sp.]HEX5356201.1 nitrogen fixation protein NifQ [Aquabacterium sp.]
MGTITVALSELEPVSRPGGPGAALSWAPDPGASMSEEIEDLVALLLEHASYPGPLAQHLARALAEASMGANHLWEDLGLGSRDQLNALMQEHFSSLKALNSGNMRWKKFFYRMLCERAEILICKSPHCEQCEDRPICFE